MAYHHVVNSGVHAQRRIHARRTTVGTLILMSEVDGVARPLHCPPANASARTGTFYRLAAKTLPSGSATTAADWSLPFANRKGECAGRSDVCECHAFSVFEELDDAVRATELIPPFKGKSIASVAVIPAMGVLMKTPVGAGGGQVLDSHHDWWPTPSTLIPVATVQVPGSAAQVVSP